MMRMDGKVAVVTGGGSGIGLATAELLAEEGARVYVVDLAQHAEPRRPVEFLRHDVRDEAGWSRVLERILDEEPGIDALINAAGVIRYAPIIDVDDEEWDFVLGVNQTGTWLSIRAVAPHLRDGGSIVNVSSGWGLTAGEVAAAYHASKGAIHGITKHAAQSLAPRGIRVNTVVPGWIETPLTDAQDPEINAAVVRSIPLGHGGKPRDVAFACLFLVSDESRFVTGSDLLVEGGSLSG